MHALGTHLIVLVRFFLAWTFTLLLAAVACLAVLVLGPTRMWTTFCHLWSRGTLWLVGVRLHVQGREHLAAPAVFIVNHESLIDVVFMPAILPNTVRFVAKKSIMYIPIFGWAFAAGGAVLIDRRRPREALESMRRGVAGLPPGWSIIVFPEGTRPRAAGLGRFKKGAFLLAIESGLPIVPIGVVGARSISPPAGWLVRGGDVWVSIGAPISTQDWHLTSLPTHVAVGRAAVATCIAQAQAMVPAAATVASGNP